MKFVYLGLPREKNFFRGLDRALNGDGSRIVHSYHSVPKDLGDYEGILFSNRVDSVFGNFGVLEDFVEDLRVQRVPLLWMISRARFNGSKLPEFEGIKYGKIYTDRRKFKFLAEKVLKFTDVPRLSQPQNLSSFHYCEPKES